MREPKPPKFVTVAIMTTITIIFWVFFTVYQALTTKTETTVPPKVLETLNPNLDTESLESLKSRTFFSENQIVEFTSPIVTPIPTEAPETEPVSTDSASLGT